MSSSCLIVGGTIAERAITNPIVLGIIPATALVLKTYWGMKDFKIMPCSGLILKTSWGKKDFKKSIELCRFAFTTYVMTLIELRPFLRGVSFDKESHPDLLKTA